MRSLVAVRAVGNAACKIVPAPRRFSSMSLAEITAELPNLTPAERAELARALQQFEPFNDPEVMARISESIARFEVGGEKITKAGMEDALRRAGREV